MTVKEFFQNLGQNIGEGWASLKSRLFSHHESPFDDAVDGNPLLISELPKSQEDSVEYASSTAVMTGKLVDVSEPASLVENQNLQPAHDFDALPVTEGIQKFEPTLSQRISIGAGKVVNGVTLFASSIFRRDSQAHYSASGNEEWLDSSKDGFVRMAEEESQQSAFRNF